MLGAVSYVRDLQGTRAEMTIMPDLAFRPEPILLQPQFHDLDPTPAAP